MLESTRAVEGSADRAHRRAWSIALVAVLAGYAALTVVMFTGSPLDRLDAFFYHLNLVPSASPGYLPLSLYVLIGQGVPASTIAALYAIHRSIRTRTWTPWVQFTIVLILLNTSVGAMKHITGRLGPKQTGLVHTVWAGGTIFPSGHTANAVVMYGLIALIAPVARRRLVTAMAAVLSVTIGLGTVALNTHWISDVFGGWLAGVLVLLMLRPLTPPADRGVLRLTRRVTPALGDWWVASPLRAVVVGAAPPSALALTPPAVVPAQLLSSDAHLHRWGGTQRPDGRARVDGHIPDAGAPPSRPRSVRRRRRYALAHGP